MTFAKHPGNSRSISETERNPWSETEGAGA